MMRDKPLFNLSFMLETLQMVAQLPPKKQAEMIEEIEAQIDPYYLTIARTFLSQ
jgi:hypothetical protein